MVTLDLITHKSAMILLLGIISFCVTMLLTPIYTHFAYKHKWWKLSRTHSTTGERLEVISRQEIHRQIPFMAGAIMVIAIAAVTFALNLNRNQTWLPLAAILGGAAVGLIDDIINLRGGGGSVAGLRAPMKFAMITIVAAITAWFFYYKLGFSVIHIPFAGDWQVGIGIIPIFMLAIVSTGNAVNISDGLDGLSGGLMMSAYAAFAIIAALQGNFGIAAFCITVAGSLLSYIWFNIPPARFMMGDVGSFGLGTALGVIAMLTNTLFLLPIIGALFVAEAGSTLLQISSKKLLHRRIFIAAPLHHHLEAKGWPKTKITMRFWIIGQVCAALGVIIALIGGFAGRF